MKLAGILAKCVDPINARKLRHILEQLYASPQEVYNDLSVVGSDDTDEFTVDGSNADETLRKATFRRKVGFKFNTAFTMTHTGAPTQNRTVTWPDADLTVAGSGLGDVDTVDTFHAAEAPTAGKLFPVSGTPNTNKLLKWAATGAADSGWTDDGTSTVWTQGGSQRIKANATGVKIGTGNPAVPLDVSGACLMDSTLGVTGATTLSSTLDVAGPTIKLIRTDAQEINYWWVNSSLHRFCAGVTGDGATWYFAKYDNAGAWNGNPVTVDRATGKTTISDLSATLVDATTPTKKFALDLSNLAAGTQTWTVPNLAAQTFLSRPSATALTANKAIKWAAGGAVDFEATDDGSTIAFGRDVKIPTFVDPAGVTKKCAFDLSGITAGQTRTVAIPDIAAQTILTRPSATALTNNTVPRWATGGMGDSGLSDDGEKVLNSRSYFKFSSGSILYTTGNGWLTLLNAAGNDWISLRFGGNDANYPALKRSGTSLQVRLAGDSAYTTLDAGTLKLSAQTQLTQAADGKLNVLDSTSKGATLDVSGITAGQVRVLAVPDIAAQTILSRPSATALTANKAIKWAAGGAADAEITDNGSTITVGRQLVIGSGLGAINQIYGPSDEEFKIFANGATSGYLSIGGAFDEYIQFTDEGMKFVSSSYAGFQFWKGATALWKVEAPDDGSQNFEVSRLSGGAFTNALSIAKASGAVTLAVDLAVTEGGTGASSAADARTNLGIAQLARGLATKTNMTGNITLTATSSFLQWLNPDAAHDLTMPAGAAGLVFFVANLSGSFDISVKDNGGTGFVTLKAGCSGWFVYEAELGKWAYQTVSNYSVGVQA